MSNDVASGSLNTIRLTKLRLVAMVFEPPPAPEPKEVGKDPPPTPGDLLDGFKLTLLDDAYVILIPVSNAVSSLAPSARKAIYARTDRDGEVRRITKDDADGGVPDATRAALLEPGATYACFWTYDKNLFKGAIADVEMDARAALEVHPFFYFQLVPHRHARLSQGDREYGRIMEGLEDGRHFKLELLLYDIDGDFHDTMVHGVFGGDDLRGLRIGGTLDSRATYAVARSEALAAVYVAELVNRQAVARRAKTWPDWQFLLTAVEVAKSAQSFGTVSELEAKLTSFEWKGRKVDVDPRLTANNDAYLDFVYQCAEAGVDRKLVCEAIDVRQYGPDDAWRAAAIEIRDKHKIQHPGFDASGALKVLPVYKDGIQNYFDFYEWGFKQRQRGWAEKVKDVAEKLDAEAASLRARLCSFLGKRATYSMLIADLAAHVRGSEEHRKAFHRRYLELALAVGYDWWNHFAELDDDQRWARRKQYLAWIGSLNDKLGELFGHFFGDPLVAKALNAMLLENGNKFEKLFDNMSKYQTRMEGKLVGRKHGDGTFFEANFKDGTVVVKKGKNVEETIGGFKFVVIGEEVATQVQRELPRRKRTGMRRRFTTVTETKVVHSVRVTNKIKHEQRWPTWMAAFGDSVAFCLTMVELRDSIQRERTDVEMMGKVGRDTFQAVSSVGSALNVLNWLPRKAWLLRAVEVANPAGAVLEAVFNVKEGLTLILDETSPAWENAGTAVGWLHYAKGWVLVGSVAGGVGAGALAAVGTTGGLVVAVGAALTPLAIGLAIGAILVVGIDLVIDDRSGPTSSMAGYDSKLKRTLEDELDGKKVSRTHDDLGLFLADANRVLAVLER